MRISTSNTAMPLAALPLLLLLLSASSVSTEDDGADYSEAVNIMSENINKAAEKSEELVNEHMENVEKDPGDLITKEAMENLVKGNTFLPQKAGTKSITLEAGQGFNGITNYQPAGWKVSETMSGPVDKEEEKSEEEEDTFAYPFGLGPVLMNQCTERNYTVTSPCYNSKLFDIEDTACANLMDAAGYIGVGFDGRGYYNSESRKVSLVQRVCENKDTFHGKEVPDMMNVFGIYHTVAETKSFQSVDEYMKFIRHQAGLSNQKGLFTSEASKYSKASSFGANLGAIGTIVGAGIGAAVGGGAGAAMGAALGGAIGGSIGGGSGSGSGSSSSKDEANAKSNVEQSASINQQQGSTQNFFAVMYVNVILYEITLDEIKPTDLSLSLLKDYMDLPPSYFSVGADVKYQTFLLRWGTHFIRSGKFGGQLKVTKTCKTSQHLSSQEFARVAESEFKSMFATLQSSYSQKSSSWSILGFGGKKKSAEQKATAKTESEYKSQMEQENKQQQKMSQSEFTQTSVEAQGGTPEIAEAIMDFYTPSFKQLFHDWLVSIKDYAKPFEFQLKSIHDLFNMRMSDLFPSGDMNFGCGGGDKGEVDIKVEAATKKRYYIDTRVRYAGEKEIEEKIKVYCKYSSRDDFESDLNRRRLSLERAIAAYMVEGPFPTSSVQLPAGEVGCEAATLGKLGLSNEASDLMSYSELKSGPFLLTFDLPQEIPNIATKNAKFRVIYSANRWFASDPEATKINLYDGCMVGDTAKNKVCFKNLIFTYEESSGFFYIQPEDFKLSKRLMPSLPNWLAGATIARPKRMQTAATISKGVSNKEIYVPCNVRWLNSQRLDPNKNENCLHFTGATEGNIFVIFSSIPRDHNTWYYLQISPEGAAFYQAMKLEKREVHMGMGVLGDKNLFQSFFVCVTQKKNSVLMQYGKADPDSEVGTVYSSYMFPVNSAYSRLSFYAFGSGEKEVSLMEVRLTKHLPKVECLNDNYVKVDGHCVLDCHPECDECTEAKNNKACHQCKHVRVEQGSGETKQTECLPECPARYFKSDSKEKLCVPCPAGLYKDKEGNQNCSKCKTGSFSAEKAEQCLPCAAGTFSSSEGQSSCQKCAAGTFSKAIGASKCDKCPAGTYSEPGKSQCDPCPYGHYGDVIGLPKCKPCAKGYYSDKRGQSSCQRCPHGTSSAEGSRSCTNNCPEGKYSPKKGVPCQDCPPGSYAESAGSTSCSKCRPGSFQPLSGHSKCTPAAKGTYVSETGATHVQRCPPGTYNNNVGQSSKSSCKPCPVGTHSPGSPLCTPCPKGSYQKSTGQSTCQKASPGHYVDATGQTAQRRCEPGTYSSTSGADRCSQCPKGHFTSSSGTATCGKCPAGMFASHEGQRTCDACPSGHYTNSTGSIKCSTCAGTVSSDRTSCSTLEQLKLSQCEEASTRTGTTCSRAYDGNTNQNFHSESCTHTLGNTNDWWSARTSGLAQITKVKVYNRGDCCQDRLDNIEIKVDDKVCATSTGAFMVKEFDCVAVGSKITIASRKRTVISLCEVQVTGKLLRVEQLKLSRCLQTTIYQGHVCARAYDGNTNQVFAGNSCANTNTVGRVNDWWAAYTSGPAIITKVKVYNRVDCCQSRLDNFEIKVDDKVCATSTGIFSVKEFNCNAVGSKITIASRKKVMFALCEVQVTGQLLKLAQR